MIERGPRWAVILLMLGASIAFCIDSSSTLFLLIPNRWVELLVELVALAAGVYAFRNMFRGIPSGVAIPWVAVAALVAALALATGAMSQQWDLNPQGQWDAWSIWNLRAKFLADHALAARAWSPLLRETHPEYPLLLPAAVARTGMPIALGYAFFLSLIATVTGGLAIARGPLAGLITGLTLATSGALLHEVPSQYADVPLAAYLAGALVFILIDRPLWAGVFASLGAWTKDEGALFCVALLLLVAILRRKDFLRTAIGMLPGALFYLGFKTFLAPHVTAQFGAGTLSRLADFSRWSIVLKGVATQIVSLGSGWFHPVFIIAALAFAVKLRNDSRRDAYFATGLAVTILAGYCVTMVAASADAVWQTNTAAGRLIVQWWPLAVIAMITWLRPAEELSTAESTGRPLKKP
jgi:hypothetical protein